MIRFDRHVSFKSIHYLELCKLLGIKPQHCFSYSHRFIGLVESLQSKIGVIIKQSLEGLDQRLWDTQIQEICFTSNNFLRPGQNYSSHYLGYGYHPRDLTDICFDTNCEIPETRIHIRQNYLEQKRYYDRKHSQETYTEGQAVSIYDPSLKNGESKTFTTQCKAPGYIVKKLHPNAYQIKLRNSRGEWSLEDIAIQRLRPFHQKNETLEKYGIYQE